MYKGYKIRLYPTKEQEELMWKHIHTCRFIWNYMLELQEKRYHNGEKHLSVFSLMKELTILKQNPDYLWLYEVSNHSLQDVCKDLEFAYQSFYKKTNGLPKFKSKRKTKNWSYPTRSDRLVFKDGYVKLEVIKNVKAKITFVPQGKIYNPRISFVNNKWILSFAVECENQAVETTDIPMGIDLGIKEFAVVSFGDEKLVFHNINYSKRVRTLQHKLKHIQRARDRKMRTNGNFEKTKGIQKYERIEKQLNCKLKNIRRNYIHYVTHELVKLLPNKITIENLDVMSMMKNKHVAKYVELQGFCIFAKVLRYKCENNNIEFQRADRWFPSSKMCSNCGNIKKKMYLADRVYKCSKCGFTIDRDYNAAINLMRYVPPTERCTA